MLFPNTLINNKNYHPVYPNIPTNPNSDNGIEFRGRRNPKPYYIAFEDGYIDSSLQFNYNLKDHLGNIRKVINATSGTVTQSTDYYPFGLAINTTGSSNNKYLYNGKEIQSGSGFYDFEARMYDAGVGRWFVVDPLAAIGPQYSPYIAFFNNPIIFTDPDGRWPIYGKDGKYLGNDGKYEKGKDLAFTGTASYDKKGNITGFENISQFTDNHKQFQIISNIVKHECVSNDVDEYLWVAHTANNAGNVSGKSMYSKLMSGYSSVGKADKTELSITNNSTAAKFARAGVIDVMSGGADPTDGATLWDGTDFLAWGLQSPNGTPHNKFEEYKSISISSDIFSSFLTSQLGKYTSGKVNYSGTNYELPADVFIDEVNWNKEGNFFFNTGEKQSYGLKATGTAGRSIFWKKEK